MMNDSPFVFILKLVIGISALSLVVCFFLVPYLKADDVLEFQECEVVNVILTSAFGGTPYNTVIVRLADGSLKKFTGSDPDFLIIKTGDFVTVKVSGKVGYSLQYRLFFEEVSE